MIVITLVKNSENTIQKTIHSLEKQSLKVKLWIILDENSNDNTIKIIKKSRLKKLIISKKSNGIFNAYNNAFKVIKKNKFNDVIFFLHSDDILYSKNILKNVSKIFIKYKNDCLYGDIVFYKNNPFKFFRIWRSDFKKKQIILKKNLYKLNFFSRNDFIFGWSYPHTSFFFHSRIIKKIPKYITEYKTSADYGWSVKLLLNNSFKILYFQKNIVKMKFGGHSTKILNLFQNLINDFKIIKKIFYKSFFDFPFCLTVLIFKKIRKIKQFT